MAHECRSSKEIEACKSGMEIKGDIGVGEGAQKHGEDPKHGS